MPEFAQLPQLPNKESTGKLNVKPEKPNTNDICKTLAGKGFPATDGIIYLRRDQPDAKREIKKANQAAYLLSEIQAALKNSVPKEKGEKKEVYAEAVKAFKFAMKFVSNSDEAFIYFSKGPNLINKEEKGYSVFVRNTDYKGEGSLFYKISFSPNENGKGVRINSVQEYHQ